MASPLTVIFPGYPPVPVTTAEGTNQWKLDVGRFCPRSDQFVVTLTASLPADIAIAVFVSVTTLSGPREFVRVGTLSSKAPSAICRIPRAELDFLGPDGNCALVVGFVAETLTADAPSVDGSLVGVTSAAAVAKFVASDFHSFVASHSFDNAAAAQAAAARAAAEGKEILVLPTGVVDRWLMRFMERCTRDPGFLRNVSL